MTKIKDGDTANSSFIVENVLAIVSVCSVLCMKFRTFYYFQIFVRNCIGILMGVVFKL